MRNRWHRHAATVFGMCAVASLLFLAKRPATPMAQAARSQKRPIEATLSASTPTLPSDPTTSNDSDTLSHGEAVPLPHQRARVKTSPVASASDTLAEEVQLLSSALSQLNSGQAALALLSLDEHQKQFSNGALSEERNAAKARALCMLHRFGEGRAMLALLAQGTPLAERVSQDCESTSATTDGP